MTHRVGVLVAPAYNTMSKTFADEILSKRFKRTAKKQPAEDPTKREHPTTLKRAIEEVEGSSSSGVSLRPSELRFEPKVSTSLGTQATVQPKRVSPAVTPRYGNEYERWSRKVELERSALWKEHRPQPKAKAKTWQVSVYLRRYLSELSSAIFSIRYCQLNFMKKQNYQLRQD